MSSLSAHELRFTFSIVIRPEDPEDPSIDLGVVDFTAHEQISSCFQINLNLAVQDEIDLDQVIGKEAVLRIRGDEADRYFNGIISEFMLTGSKGRFYLYRAKVVPSLWLLSLEQDFRIFQNKSAREIVSRILQDAGISLDSFAFRPESIGSEPREYCVQYNESDLDFISRLLEEEGIFYFFEHSADRHVLVFGDSAAVYQAIPGESPEDDDYYESSEEGGSPEILYHLSEGRVPEEETVYKFTFSRRIYSGKVTLRDFSFENPAAHQTSLTSEQQAREDNFHRLEVYDYPGRYSDESRGRNLAQIRLERAMLFKEKANGESVCSRFVPGFTFSLTGHDCTDFDQEYLLVEVVHNGAQPQVLEELADAEVENKYNNRFMCIPSYVTFRPWKDTPKPTVKGPQTAIVVGPEGEEIYTDEDGHGRVKIQFHWDREGRYNEESSCWVRVSHSWAGGRYGYFSLPRVGQEVIVGFLEGDPDRPLITGRVYNADHLPPVDLPAEKTKSTIKSKTYTGDGANEIRFEDNVGEEQIFLHAQKDMDIKVLHDQKTTVENERHLLVKGAAKTRMDSLDVTVDNDSAIKVSGNRSLTVDGDLLEKFGSHLEDSGEIYLKAGTKVIIEAGMQISLKAAGGFIDIGPAGVTIQGTLVNINSGGAAGSSGLSGSPAVPEAPDETGTTISGTDMVYTPVAVREAAPVDESEPPEEDEEGDEESILEVTLVRATPHFAPGEEIWINGDPDNTEEGESCNIEYTVNDPDDIATAGTLEIFRDAQPGSCIFRADLEADQFNHGDHTFEWDGMCTDGPLADKYADILHSPYKIKVTITGGGQTASAESENEDQKTAVILEEIRLQRESYTEDGEEPEEGSNAYYQYRLIQLGFHCGPVDGNVGTKTRRAIRAFWHAHPYLGTGMGILSNDTKCVIDNTAPGGTGNAHYKFILNYLGYFCGELNNTINDDATRHAITRYRAIKGLADNGGNLDAETKNSLDRETLDPLEKRIILEGDDGVDEVSKNPFPNAGAEKKIFIDCDSALSPSNLPYNRKYSTETRRLLRPSFATIVRPMIKRTNNTLVFAPDAVGSLRIDLSLDTNAPPADLGIPDAVPRTYAQAALGLDANKTTGHHTHTNRGGVRRNNNCGVFVTGHALRPYNVRRDGNWCYCNAVTDDHRAKGTAGVYFRPSTIAGDRFSIIATVNDDGFDTPPPAPISAQTGTMIVWRRYRIAKVWVMGYPAPFAMPAYMNNMETLLNNWYAPCFIKWENPLEMKTPAETPDPIMITPRDADTKKITLDLYRHMLRETGYTPAQLTDAQITTRFNANILFPLTIRARNVGAGESAQAYRDFVDGQIAAFEGRFAATLRRLSQTEAPEGAVILIFDQNAPVAGNHGISLITTGPATGIPVQWSWSSLASSGVVFQIYDQDNGGAPHPTLPAPTQGETLAHELGHLLWMHHACTDFTDTTPVGGPASKNVTPPLAQDRREHDHNEYETCTMSYLDLRHFCGKCILKLRGWNEQRINHNLVP